MIRTEKYKIQSGEYKGVVVHRVFYGSRWIGTVYFQRPNWRIWWVYKVGLFRSKWHVQKDHELERDYKNKKEAISSLVDYLLPNLL